MRIVVVGGGTAGFMTAALIRQLLPSVPVQVVHSPEIGTVGAGEGTTPYFVSRFTEEVGLPLSTLIRDAGATLKLAVRFVDWRGDGSSYLHPFDGQEAIGLDMRLLHPDAPDDGARLHLLSYLAERGRVPLTPRPGEPPADVDDLSGLSVIGDIAVHFDASRFAALLARHAADRGVAITEGRVVQAIQGPDGDLVAIRLADGREITGDLFFDCTGFRRLLLGKVFGARWIDVHDALPVRRALPFTLPMLESPLPLTDAIAMRAGWCWKIPVEGRYGCGYVFDPDFLTDEGAADEVLARFPRATLGEPIGFQAGYFDRIWERNVIAVGLSSGFLEPLEATSIWHAVLALREALLVYLPMRDQPARDDLNRFHRTFMERTVAFLHAHYLTGRADTPFWSTFEARTRRPPLLQELMRDGHLRWLIHLPPALAGHPSPFIIPSWNQIACGTGLACPTTHRAYWDYFSLYDEHAELIRRRRSELARIAEGCLTHEQALAVSRRQRSQQAV